WGAYLDARQELTIAIAKVLADNRLDAIVHKTVEHQPTYIKDGINPPYVNNKGIPALNTFLVFAATMTVPSGFTSDNLPVGITFLGPAYSEPTLLKLAYAYEQATHHRMPPKTAPALPCGLRKKLANFFPCQADPLRGLQIFSRLHPSGDELVVASWGRTARWMSN